MDITIDNSQITEAEIGWLAGILDGEGSIILSNTKVPVSKERYQHAERIQYAPKITMVNTDPELIAKYVKLLDKLGVGCGVYEKNSVNRLGNKQQWQVMVSRMKSVKIFLDLLLPHLTCKKAKAELLLRFINLRLNKVGAKGMTNEDRAYSTEEIDVCNQFRNLRDYTCDPVYRDDIVRPVPRGTESSRND